MLWQTGTTALLKTIGQQMSLLKLGGQPVALIEVGSVALSEFPFFHPLRVAAECFSLVESRGKRAVSCVDSGMWQDHTFNIASSFGHHEMKKKMSRL